MKQFSLIFVLLLSALSALAQHYTRSFRSDVASLRVQYDAEYSSESLLKRPYLVLSDDMVADGQVLEISFDQLSHETHSYTYTLRHLNADWTNDALSSTDYLRGFTTVDITDYEHSVNTIQLYTHYRFSFPNEDMKPLISGNYCISIYEDARQERPVAEVCFSVVEPQADITTTVRSNTDVELSGRYQQLDVEVNTSGLNIFTPDQLTLVVQQNGRTDNMVFAPKPTFVEQDRLRYINCRSLIFEGGNEYRHFDIASQYFKGENVENVAFDHNYYYAFLYPSELREVYVYDRDANGRYVINAERTDYDDTEADYMNVMFLLPVERPWLDGSVYVMGDAFGTAPGENNRMTYDAEHGVYTYSAFLKQGGYEWLYGFYNTRTGSGVRVSSSSSVSPAPSYLRGASMEKVEGSFWQTRNTYRIFAYVRTTGDRYDRLVAVSDVE